MSQQGPYAHQILVASRRTLRQLVVALLTEDDHQHNFEVWMDSLILSVNESGLECVLAAYERAMPGIRPILEAEVARAKAKEKEKEKDGESE